MHCLSENPIVMASPVDVNLDSYPPALYRDIEYPAHPRFSPSPSSSPSHLLADTYHKYGKLARMSSRRRKMRRKSDQQLLDPSQYHGGSVSSLHHPPGDHRSEDEVEEEVEDVLTDLSSMRLSESDDRSDLSELTETSSGYESMFSESPSLSLSEFEFSPSSAPQSGPDPGSNPGPSSSLPDKPRSFSQSSQDSTESSSSSFGQDEEKNRKDSLLYDVRLTDEQYMFFIPDMDLVKSHLMFAVREEVDVLKDRIVDLVDRVKHLECENSILRQYASPDVLQQIQSQMPPQIQQNPHHSSN